MDFDGHELEHLADNARTIRQHIVRMVASAGAGHPGGSLSAVDVIVCLYDSVMRIDPTRPDWPERDRFVLSKGHASPALYAKLAEKGYFGREHLLTFDHIGSILQGHPDMTKTPGIDMSTGSLGQGLSVGVGMALGARLRGLSFHTYVMLGDGELQEGQVWEAAMLAAKYHLSNLTAIIDTNGLQLVDAVQRVMPSSCSMTDKWRAFGWNTLEMDGHNVPEILKTLDRARAFRDGPSVIISNTVKGKGVSFMEGKVAWHSRGINEDELALALSELSADGGASL